MTNPLSEGLYDAEDRPIEPIPFDRIRPEHVEPALSALVAKAREAVAALARDTSAPTYENVLGALERATLRLEAAAGIVEHLESSATSDELRKAWAAAQPVVSEFWSSLPLDAALYARLEALEASPAGKALTGAERRHLDKTLEEFRRHGAGLDDAGKKQITEIDVELARLTTKYQQNVLDATNAYELVIEDPARLAGLPEFALAAARKSAEEKRKKGYRFTLHAPSFIPAITYLDDRSLREELYRAYNARASSGPHDNAALMRDILALRRRKAALLGFATFADLTTADRMARSSGRVRTFLDDLRARTAAHFEREKAALRDFAATLVPHREPGEAAPPSLEAWDTAYVAAKRRRALYDFDETTVRAHFPLEHVLAGLFSIFRELYGVTFEPATMPVWDESVRPFVLRDEAGTKLANVYVDLFPRANKVQGAWMVPLRSATPPFAHAAVVSANFTPKVGATPSLLAHREVQTLFHEFGHLLHQCLSDVPVRRLAGTSVAWDFVELPSQLHENWVWERASIRMLSKHHETGGPMPDELVEKLLRSRTYRSASMQMQQIGYADLDLRLHTEIDPAGADVVRLARELLAPYVTAPLPESFAMIASFVHLFGSPVGYAAGYYSYKWAEVLEADAFSRFAKEGLMSREAGRAFADSILKRGNSEEADVLFRSFMGRDPTVDALLARQGLA
jgi:oligopeptidase A